MSLSMYLSFLNEENFPYPQPYPAKLYSAWLEQGHMTTSEPITDDGCHDWFRVFSTYAWAEGGITFP